MKNRNAVVTLGSGTNEVNTKSAELLKPIWSAKFGEATLKRQYGVWYDTKTNPPPLGVWCVGRKGTHKPFTFLAMEEGEIFKGTAYIDADNAYRDPDHWQAIAP